MTQMQERPRIRRVESCIMTSTQKFLRGVGRCCSPLTKPPECPDEWNSEHTFDISREHSGDHAEATTTAGGSFKAAPLSWQGCAQEPKGPNARWSGRKRFQSQAESYLIRGILLLGSISYTRNANRKLEHGIGMDVACLPPFEESVPG